MTLKGVLRGRIAGWLLAMGFVLLCYSLLQLIGRWSLGVAPRLSAVPGDLLVHVILGTILYAMSRNLRVFMPAAALLLAALHLSNAGKLAVLGSPIMPDDFLAVKNLFLLLQGWQLLGIILVLALPLAMLMLTFAWRSTRAWLLVGLLSIVVGAFLLTPTTIVRALDRHVGNSVWNQRGNYESRGLLLHLLQETARYLARAGSPPSRPEVIAALRQLNADTLGAGRIGTRAASTHGKPARNVHLILLESFWDPMLLESSGISPDPVDPRFRQLWQQTGYSKAMSPVFGGYTANAEFEVLCGFPVTEDAVFFEGWLRRDVPCLPDQLRSMGYRTLVSHPNVAGFWNRVNAYRRIGFDTYWSINDFVLDDMNRNFLSDRSLYRQVMEKIARQPADSAVFNYVLTFFGHLDYPLNAQRPPRVTVKDGSTMLTAYANTIHYKSRELMDFLQTLRQTDPDALIVLFGDHLPFLGPNFAGFTEAGYLADSRAKFDASMVQRLVSTPLIIIDGQRGPQVVHDLPMYLFPAMIMSLLANDQPAWVRLLERPHKPIIRPLPGMHLLLDGDARTLCRQSETPKPECTASSQWLGAAITLTHDLFGGKQFVLKQEMPAKPRVAKTLGISPEQRP
jgi:hypothetical protein